MNKAQKTSWTWANWQTNWGLELGFKMEDQYTGVKWLVHETQHIWRINLTLFCSYRIFHTISTLNYVVSFYAYIISTYGFTRCFNPLIREACCTPIIYGCNLIILSKLRSEFSDSPLCLCHLHTHMPTFNAKSRGHMTWTHFWYCLINWDAFMHIWR